MEHQLYKKREECELRNCRSKVRHILLHIVNSSSSFAQNRRVHALAISKIGGCSQTPIEQHVLSPPGLPKYNLSPKHRILSNYAGFVTMHALKQKSVRTVLCTLLLLN